MANVDGSGRAAIFVDTAHISTDDTVTIFVYHAAHLTLAGRLLAFGSDYGIKFGFNCARSGTAHEIVAHSFLLNGHRWRRSDTNYLWRNGRLVRSGQTRTAALHGYACSNWCGLLGARANRADQGTLSSQPSLRLFVKSRPLQGLRAATLE
jgi:hypothetical protein